MNERQHDELLRRYGVDRRDELGHGGEAWVYPLDAGRVLRVHRHEAQAYVRRIAELYATLDRAAVPYALPEVLEVHGDGDVSWSIERRLPGRPFDALLPLLVGTDRADALAGYVDGAAAFGALGLPHGWPGGYGELFTEEALHAEGWGDLLAARLHLQLEQGRPVLIDALPDLDVAAGRVIAEARGEEAVGPPVLVHGDWFPGNVLVGDDLQVSAAIDLGWLTVIGDPTHDVRSAVVFTEVRPWHRPGDSDVLLAAARRHLGPETDELVDRTRRFEQLRFAFVDEDEHLHRWCVDGLRALTEHAP